MKCCEASLLIPPLTAAAAAAAAATAARAGGAEPAQVPQAQDAIEGGSGHQVAVEIDAEATDRHVPMLVARRT